jgi:nucleoid-associated protein YejK
MTQQKLFKSANEFSLHIEDLVKEHRISHMDAVLKYCTDNMLEPEEIASKVNKSLKEKIAVNMQELNFLPKQASLDL